MLMTTSPSLVTKFLRLNAFDLGFKARAQRGAAQSEVILQVVLPGLDPTGVSLHSPGDVSADGALFSGGLREIRRNKCCSDVSLSEAVNTALVFIADREGMWAGDTVLKPQESGHTFSMGRGSPKQGEAKHTRLTKKS